MEEADPSVVLGQLLSACENATVMQNTVAPSDTSGRRGDNAHHFTTSSPVAALLRPSSAPSPSSVPPPKMMDYPTLPGGGDHRGLPFPTVISNTCGEPIDIPEQYGLFATPNGQSGSNWNVFEEDLRSALEALCLSLCLHGEEFCQQCSLEHIVETICAAVSVSRAIRVLELAVRALAILAENITRAAGVIASGAGGGLFVILSLLHHHELIATRRTLAEETLHCLGAVTPKIPMKGCGNLRAAVVHQVIDLMDHPLIRAQTPLVLHCLDALEGLLQADDFSDESQKSGKFWRGAFLRGLQERLDIYLPEPETPRVVGHVSSLESARSRANGSEASRIGVSTLASPLSLAEPPNASTAAMNAANRWKTEGGPIMVKYFSCLACCCDRLPRERFADLSLMPKPNSQRASKAEDDEASFLCTMTNLCGTALRRSTARLQGEVGEGWRTAVCSPLMTFFYRAPKEAAAMFARCKVLEILCSVSVYLLDGRGTGSGAHAVAASGSEAGFGRRSPAHSESPVADGSTLPHSASATPLATLSGTAEVQSPVCAAPPSEKKRSSSSSSFSSSFSSTSSDGNARRGGRDDLLKSNATASVRCEKDSLDPTSGELISTPAARHLVPPTPSPVRNAAPTCSTADPVFGIESVEHATAADFPTEATLEAMLLHDDIRAVPVLSAELSILPLLECLLSLLPPPPSPVGHADFVNVTRPYHTWLWEDDLGRPHSCGERLSSVLELVYQDPSQSWGSPHDLLKWFWRDIQARHCSEPERDGGLSSNKTPCVLRRQSLMGGFIHGRVNGLSRGCRCTRRRRRAVPLEETRRGTTRVTPALQHSLAEQPHRSTTGPTAGNGDGVGGSTARTESAETDEELFDTLVAHAVAGVPSGTFLRAATQPPTARSFSRPTNPLLGRSMQKEVEDGLGGTPRGPLVSGTTTDSLCTPLAPSTNRTTITRAPQERVGHLPAERCSSARDEREMRRQFGDGKVSPQAVAAPPSSARGKDDADRSLHQLLGTDHRSLAEMVAEWEAPTFDDVDDESKQHTSKAKPKSWWKRIFCCMGCCDEESDEEAKTGSELFIFDYVSEQQLEAQRKAFQTEEGLMMLLSTCVPHLSQLAEKTVNPLVARHCAVLTLRILALTTLHFTETKKRLMPDKSASVKKTAPEYGSQTSMSPATSWPLSGASGESKRPSPVKAETSGFPAKPRAELHLLASRLIALSPLLSRSAVRLLETPVKGPSWTVGEEKVLPFRVFESVYRYSHALREDEGISTQFCAHAFTYVAEMRLAAVDVLLILLRWDRQHQHQLAKTKNGITESEEDMTVEEEELDGVFSFTKDGDPSGDLSNRRLVPTPMYPHVFHAITTLLQGLLVHRQLLAQAKQEQLLEEKKQLAKRLTAGLVAERVTFQLPGASCQYHGTPLSLLRLYVRVMQLLRGSMELALPGSWKAAKQRRMASVHFVDRDLPYSNSFAHRRKTQGTSTNPSARQMFMLDWDNEDKDSTHSSDSIMHGRQSSVHSNLKEAACSQRTTSGSPCSSPLYARRAAGTGADIRSLLCHSFERETKRLVAQGVPSGLQFCLALYSLTYLQKPMTQTKCGAFFSPEGNNALRSVENGCVTLELIADHCPELFQAAADDLIHRGAAACLKCCKASLDPPLPSVVMAKGMSPPLSPEERPFAPQLRWLMERVTRLVSARLEFCAPDSTFNVLFHQPSRFVKLRRKDKVLHSIETALSTTLYIRISHANRMTFHYDGSVREGVSEQCGRRVGAECSPNGSDSEGTKSLSSPARASIMQNPSTSGRSTRANSSFRGECPTDHRHIFHYQGHDLVCGSDRLKFMQHLLLLPKTTLADVAMMVSNQLNSATRRGPNNRSSSNLNRTSVNSNMFGEVPSDTTSTPQGGLSSGSPRFTARRSVVQVEGGTEDPLTASALQRHSSFRAFSPNRSGSFTRKARARVEEFTPRHVLFLLNGAPVVAPLTTVVELLATRSQDGVESVYELRPTKNTTSAGTSASALNTEACEVSPLLSLSPEATPQSFTIETVKPVVHDLEFVLLQEPIPWELYSQNNCGCVIQLNITPEEGGGKSVAAPSCAAGTTTGNEPDSLPTSGTTTAFFRACNPSHAYNMHQRRRVMGDARQALDTNATAVANSALLALMEALTTALREHLRPGMHHGDSISGLSMTAHVDRRRMCSALLHQMYRAIPTFMLPSLLERSLLTVYPSSHYPLQRRSVAVIPRMARMCTAPVNGFVGADNSLTGSRGVSHEEERASSPTPADVYNVSPPDGLGDLAMTSLWSYPLLYSYEMRKAFFHVLLRCHSMSKLPRVLRQTEILQPDLRHCPLCMPLLPPALYFTSHGLDWVDRDGGITSTSQRIRVEVTREPWRLLAMGTHVLNRFATCSLTLDVLFTGEPGIGLGPALEFLELLGNCFLQPELRMFRTEEVLVSEQRVMSHTPAPEEVVVESRDPSPWQSERQRATFLTPSAAGDLSAEQANVAACVSPSPLIPSRGDAQSPTSVSTGQNRYCQQVCPSLFPSFDIPDSALTHFHTLGLFVGRLLRMRRTTRLRFHPLFLQALRDDCPLAATPAEASLHLQLLDPPLEHSLQLLEQMNDEELEAMDLTFELQRSGNAGGTVELLPNGREMEVRAWNVREYTHYVREQHLDVPVRKALVYFRNGLFTTVHPAHFSLFSVPELDLLLSGDEGKIWETPDDLAPSVLASHGYTSSSRIIRDFIRIVTSWSATQQRLFLRFLTGCSSIGSFGLQPPITVVRRDVDQMQLQSRSFFSTAPTPHEETGVTFDDMDDDEDLPGSFAYLGGPASPTSPSLRSTIPISASQTSPNSGYAALSTQWEVDGMLPSVSTCFHYLKLPQYSSYEILEERLLRAVLDGQGSFGLS